MTLTVPYPADLLRIAGKVVWYDQPEQTLAHLALHILDRFHIVANMNKALDNVRAEETGRMKREGRAPVLRKSHST